MSTMAQAPLPIIPGLAPGPEHQIPSLPEVHASVRLSRSPNFWRRLAGFIGPGFLISVGYMDPGNWATDIAGGSRFGYTLLFVIMASNLMAILLQSLSLKLGVATERDLAQLCHQAYGPRVSYALWIGAEIAIALNNAPMFACPVPTRRIIASAMPARLSSGAAACKARARASMRLCPATLPLSIKTASACRATASWSTYEQPCCGSIISAYRMGRLRV